MVDDSQEKRPNFLRPPVVEAIIGVQFEPIASFTVAHFGLFWERIRQDYSRVEFREPNPPASQYATVPPFLPLRAWFVDASESQLVQLQNDRIIYNWRKAAASEYPHYKNMRPTFAKLWQTLLTFLSEEKLGSPNAPVCEITYVNRISTEDITSLSPRLNESFLMLPPDPPLFAKGARFVGFNEVLVLQPEQIQLQLALMSGMDEDKRAMLQLQISTTSTPGLNTPDEILANLDVNQQTAVRVFVESTSTALHEKWGRVDNR